MRCWAIPTRITTSPRRPRRRRCTALFRRTVAVGEKYGTVGVLDRDRVLHEVTTFRRDVATDGRHAVVAYGVSLDEDLARRDFTINAIAYHPLRHEWRDPFGGRDDLEARLDPRRRRSGGAVSRGLSPHSARRCASRRGSGSPSSRRPGAAAVRRRPDWRRLSAERVRDEWFKGLRTARSILRSWWGCGSGSARLAVDPELASVPTAASGARRAVPTERRDPVLLTVLLLDDAAPVLRRLRASNAEVERAAAVARGPDRAGGR